MSELPGRFTPRLRATRAKRFVALFLVGPLLWVAALVALGVVLSRSFVVELGLIIAAGSFLLATLCLLPMRARRVREERES
jgi:membrane protein DedA with SNARE-associated domain